jgi:phage terminase small subunit
LEILHVKGRKPKPTVLHRLQGTHNATKHRERKPIAEGELYKAPPGLSAAERRIWRSAIKYAPKGVLFQIDGTILRAWCETVARRDELQRRGLHEQRNEFCWELSAAHRNLDRVTALLVKLTGERGFSPAARPRLRVEQQPEVDDMWKQLRLIPGGRPRAAASRGGC